MAGNAVSEIADAYFGAWQAGDFARLRSILADYATFDGPLGQASSADECIAGLQRMSQIMTGIEIGGAGHDDAGPGWGTGPVLRRGRECEAYVAGPPAMVRETVYVLTRVGLRRGRIHYDDVLLADGE
jgi:hypothetical protein